MDAYSGAAYYPAHRQQWFAAFAGQAAGWRSVLARTYGEELARAVLDEARCQFEELLSSLPYIGGDENHLTGALVEAAGCLALYLALKKRGWAVENAAKVMYDALLERDDASRPGPAGTLTPEELMERRKRAAQRSQERRYPGDYVYEFVPGDGVKFDYGYNFSECAALKLYRAWGADEFAPFYCYLDFPKSTLGLQRTLTLAEGDPLCNHRFKQGRRAEFRWPPPFVHDR